MSFSILTTAFRGGDYFERYFNNVLSIRELDEVVFVADRATAGDLQSLEGWVEKDSRIKVIDANSLNVSGRASCLNLGLRETWCEYALVQDVDDISLANRLIALKKYLCHKQELNPSLIFSDFEVESSDGSRRSYRFGTGAKLIDQIFELNPPAHSACCLQVSKVLSLGGYNETLAKSIDYELYLRVMMSGSDIAYLPEVLSRIYVSRNTWGKHGLHNLQQIEGLLTLFSYVCSPNLEDYVGHRRSVSSKPELRSLIIESDYYQFEELRRVGFLNFFISIAKDFNTITSRIARLHYFIICFLFRKEAIKRVLVSMHNTIS